MEPVLLIRPGPEIPWGFRLQGGTDLQTPLTVQRVTPGSLAAAGLVVGDEILRIGSADASLLTYAAAMDTIKSCGDRLELYTARTGIPRSGEQFSNHVAPFPYAPSDQNGVAESPRVIGNSGSVPLSPLPRAGALDGVLPQQGFPDRGRRQREPTRQVPNPVLNIPSRTSEEKRPWTYAPDIHSLQQQRRRVQRRNYAPASVPANSDPSATSGEVPHRQTMMPQHPMTSQEKEREAKRNAEGIDSIYGGSEIPSMPSHPIKSLQPSSPNEAGTGGLAIAAQRRQRRREKLRYGEGSIQDGTGVKSQEPEFDEAAYLAGQIPIFGTRPTQPAAYRGAKARGIIQEPEAERDEEKPFDERAYLAGRIPLVRGGSIDPKLFNLPVEDNSKPRVADADEKEDENKKPFDERAYLAGRIPLVKGGPIDPTQFSVPERRVVRKYKEPNRPRLKEPFDEGAYLAGRLNILGEAADKPQRVPSRPPTGAKVEVVKPSWYKTDEDMVSEDEYDEDSFLKGKISIVRRSVDRDLQPHRGLGNVVRSKYVQHERASWQKDAVEAEDGRGGTCSETEFDERAYLSGRWRRHLATDKEYSTDTETDHPSKTLCFLRRSVSSDRSNDEDLRSPGGSGPSGDELGSDSEKPYDYYMYQGRKIPSKIFSRLKRTMDRKAAADKKAIDSDPIERLKKKSLENVGIDVDTAIERLEIGHHDPDTYMEILKKSVEQNDLQIEATNETTDF